MACLDVHGWRRDGGTGGGRRGKKCGCKITSVALICLLTHIWGSLRRRSCCSLYPCVCYCFVLFLLFSGSFITFLSSLFLFSFSSSSPSYWLSFHISDEYHFCLVLPIMIDTVLKIWASGHMCLLIMHIPSLAAACIASLWSFPVSGSQVREDKKKQSRRVRAVVRGKHPRSVPQMKAFAN